MKLYKSFLDKVCDIEGVSIPELMEITGKSQSVVYNWLSPSRPDCFPGIESLGKILFRLGLSFDDFIQCRHPIYDDGATFRTYYLYVSDPSGARYINPEILDLPDADRVIKAYLLDRQRLSAMIDDYACGREIDRDRFDLLCKALAPTVFSETVEFDVPEEFELCSHALERYKLGLDSLGEYKAECEKDGVPPVDYKHVILFPDADCFILLAADKGIRCLKEYLSIIGEHEKRFLLLNYMTLCSDRVGFDKKKKIMKMLLESGCEWIGEEHA